MSRERIPVVVFGAAGLSGGELMRLLALHPHFELRAAASHSHPGSAIASVHRHLNGFVPGNFLAPADALALLERDGNAVVFSCLGSHDSAETIAQIVARTPSNRVRIVDLSGDFRLGTAAAYEKAYGSPHPAPQLLGTFTYGLPELDRESIARALRIANPGCFATAVTLALAPLWQRDLARSGFSVTAITGSSGSGAKPSEQTHHPHRDGNLWAYRPLKHQHQPEIEGALVRLRPGAIDLAFVPHSAPLVRGIHATVQFTLRDRMSEADLRAAIASFYQDQPFVRVVSGCPRLSDAVGSNLCVLGVAAEQQHAVVFAVIDNLIKGAAGQAIQNMNLACDLNQQAGLGFAPLGLS